METIKRAKWIDLSLAIIGFIPAMFLWAQTLGLGMQEDNSRITGVIAHGPNIFEELPLRYCFISVSFWVFIVFLLIRKNVFLKVTSLIPLGFIITQCRLLIILKADMFGGNWPYLSWLKITYYLDFFFLALAFALLLLQIYTIWLVYRSSAAESS
jgi:hypothetical protein